MNLRHNIDPKLVQAQIEKKCSMYEDHRIRALEDTTKALAQYAITPQFFSQKPDSTYISPMYDSWIKYEREHYSKVRVIRLAKAKYILVYGDANDQKVKEGTGPFKTLKKAKEWFLTGGR